MAALPVAQAKRQDRHPRAVEIAQQLDPGVAGQPRPRHRPPARVRRVDRRLPDGVLDRKRQRRADVADDVGGAGLLARLDARGIVVAVRRDETHRAAAGAARPVRAHRVAADDQHARGARPADELVGRGDHRLHPQAQVDGQVGGAAGVVPDHSCARRVDLRGQRRHVAGDAGDVGTGRQRHHRVGHQRRRQRVRAGAAAGRLGQLDHRGARFAPRQDVRVMLVGPEDHRRPRPDAHQMHQPVDPRRRARPGKDHRVALVAVAATQDLGPRRAAGAGHGRPAGRGLGVAVGIPRQDLVHDEPLDLPQRAARGDVIGVDQRVRAERALQRDAVADQPGVKGRGRVGAERGAEAGEEIRLGHAIQFDPCGAMDHHHSHNAHISLVVI